MNTSVFYKIYPDWTWKVKHLNVKLLPNSFRLKVIIRCEIYFVLNYEWKNIIFQDKKSEYMSILHIQTDLF